MLRVSQAAVVPYRLPLRRPWRSARGVVRDRCGWLIRLRGGDGLAGYGDCAPLPEAGTELQAVARQVLDHVVPRLWGCGLADVPDLLASAPPAVRCAVETAALDLRAQAAGVALAACLAESPAGRVAVNRVAGLDEVPAADAGTVLKVKVGGQDPAAELARLRAVPRGVRLRLDANGAWAFDEAVRFLAGLAVLDCTVDAVEEPLRTPGVAALAVLQAQVPFPLALDESLSRLDLDAVLAARAVRRLVLKPMAAGGPAACAALARRAAAQGVEAVVTTTVDGAVGAWAAVQTAAAIDPGGVLCHGLATSAWLAADIATPPLPLRGGIDLPAGSGLGFGVTDRRRLARLFEQAA